MKEALETVMNHIGYRWNLGPRTGWYLPPKTPEETTQFLGLDANKLINSFYTKWKTYFATLGKTTYDFDDWSDPDLQIWDIFRAVEEYLFKGDESKYLNPWE